jgi:protein-S-isoprenylcysteine O-methyltransferase Ste14
MVEQVGTNPEVIYKDNLPTQKLFANILRVLSISILPLIILHGAGLQNIFGFSRMQILNYGTFTAIGYILGLIGLLLCWKAQREMQDSWRVGIDRKKPTKLVTTGVFKYIRNPTYSGVYLICAGSFIIFPTTWFLMWAIVFYISIEFQVRIEEEYLSESHGEQYSKYYSTTKRYLPFLY